MNSGFNKLKSDIKACLPSKIDFLALSASDFMKKHRMKISVEELFAEARIDTKRIDDLTYFEKSVLTNCLKKHSTFKSWDEFLEEAYIYASGGKVFRK